MPGSEPPIAICLRCKQREYPCVAETCVCKAERELVHIEIRAASGKCPKGYFDAPPAPRLPTKSEAFPDPLPDPLPRAEWPFIVRTIARLRGDDHRGVGDTLARAFELMGADVVKEALKGVGADCGCARRQAWLNARFPYSV